ncbi:hypothetical protein [Nocardia niwae]|uniref:hypothetical protein n=1 Tax=Nocardia niwae TaxID=626084 RepID=UPI0033EDEE13
MLDSFTAAIGPVAAASVWPTVVFLGVIAIVTLVALCRAKREDIPRIFESFAAAFGFHNLVGSGSATGGAPQLDGRESPQQLEQASGTDEPEEVA